MGLGMLGKAVGGMFGMISENRANKRDSANAQQTLAASKYWADFKREPARIRFDSPPDTYDDAFNVVTIAGTLGEAPQQPVVHAIKMLVAHYYENRRAAVVGTLTSEMPLGVSALKASS